MQLHKRSKATVAGNDAEATAVVVVGGEASAPAAAAAVASAGTGGNPFLSPHTLVEELPSRPDAGLPIGGDSGGDGGGRQKSAAAASGGGVQRDPAESAFQALLGADGEPAWACGFNFENGGGGGGESVFVCLFLCERQ